MPMRHIFTQGDYDGACFLYALANAYQAVTGRAPSCRAWDAGIRSLMHSSDFLGGCIGTTEHFASGPDALQEAVRIILGSYGGDGPTVDWRAFPEVTDLDGITPLVDAYGVVVFRYQGATAKVSDIDHWVCGVAVAARPFRLHLACSFRGTQDARTEGKRYRERYIQRYDRYSNNWLSRRHEIKFFPSSVFRVGKAGTP